MRSLSGAAFLIALVSSQATAQSAFSWFVGGGPSKVTQRGYSLLHISPFNEISSDDTLLVGGETGRGIATVGIARRLASSALNLRVEASFQVSGSESGAAAWHFGQIIRAALREETIGGHAGLEWNAIPGGSWSPYLVTSIGMARTRFRWNTDSSMTQPNRSTYSNSLDATIGFGMRARLLGANIFAESRREWWTSDWAGSRSLPLVIGIRTR